MLVYLLIVGISHTWNARRKADEKPSQCSPIATVLVVAVDAVKVVQFWNIEFAVLDDVVINQDNTSQWTKEDGV